MRNIVGLFLICFCLFLTSCEEVVNVKTDFKEEVKLNEHLTFMFNRDMIVDSLVGKPDSTNYINFNPKIDGIYHWKGKQTLTFIPLIKLKSAKNYTAILNEDVFNKKLKIEEIKFHTPYLKVENVYSYWGENREKSGELVPHFSIRFNYSIFPKDLDSLLSIKIDNKTLKLDRLSRVRAKEAIFYSKDLVFSDGEVFSDIVLKKGLCINKHFPKETGNFIDKDFEKKVELQEPYILEVRNTKVFHNGYQGTLKVWLSQDIHEEGIKKYINVYPNIDFSVSIYKNVLSINSNNFKLNKDYTINLKKGLKGKLKGFVHSDYVEQFNFGSVEPQIKFADKRGIYLLRNGQQNVGINLINVNDINVKIFKVYENNLKSYLYAGYMSYDYYSEDRINYYRPERVVNDGDIVFEKDYNKDSLKVKNNAHILNIDFKDKVKDYKGLYVLQITDKKDRWRRERKLISISDIGIVAKKGERDLFIFTNSLKTTKAVEGVKIKVIGRNNQVIGNGITDKYGVAIVTPRKEIVRGFRPAMIVAEKDNDFNYLYLSHCLTDTYNFDTGGRKKENKEYDGFIYGDREIYRSGETINICAIVRDRDMNSARSMPVIFKIKNWEGKVIKTIRKILNKDGITDFSYKFPYEISTGSYDIHLYSGNNIYINSKKIGIQDFIPNRIKVNIKSDREKIVLGDTMILKVFAENLHGTPAVNRKCRIRQSFNRIAFKPKGFDDFNFNLKGWENPVGVDVRSENTDSLGMVKEHYYISDSYKNSGVLNSEFYITVEDELHRAVDNFFKTTVFTQEKFVGLKKIKHYQVIGEDIPIDIVAVNTNEKKTDGGNVNLKVIRYDYKTVLSGSSSYYRYVSEKEEVFLLDTLISLSDKGKLVNFMPKKSGEYKVILSFEGEKTWVEENFYCYGHGLTSVGSFAVNREGKIDIKFDKNKYKVGDNAKVVFTTPFVGKMLVTVETNKVLKYFYKDTDKRALSIDLEIKDSYEPNVYITATLFKKHEETNFPLMVAHGFAPLMVENPATKFDIAISSKDKTGSNTEEVIKIKTKPNTNVTIAVVDEGILQLSREKVPNPHAHFYRRQALETKSYDIYSYLLPEINTKYSKTGGGGSYGMRLNPVPGKRVKPFALWSGILRSDDKGNISHKIKVPQFSGRVRIIATGTNKKSFASAQKEMIVADPIIISPALPLFASPKDTILADVHLTNTSKEDKKLKIGINVKGKLQLEGNYTKEVILKAGKETRIPFKLSGEMDIGLAKIFIVVKDYKKVYKHETEIPVRPASSLQKRTGSGRLEVNKQGKIFFDDADFMKQTISRKLIISNSPIVQFSKSLDYLITYPYGCLEQTISKAFPQLYFKDLCEKLNKKTDKSADKNIYEAINKLKLLQIYSGGLTFWRDQNKANHWGSTYAAHFLLEAQKAGFEVDKDFLEHILNYIESKLSKKKTIYYTFDNKKKEDFAPKENAYTLFVLALANRPNISLMNYYKSSQNLLTLDSKYLLACSYALSGDKKSFEEILPNAFTMSNYKSRYSRSFDSPIRDLAIVLSTLCDADSNNSQIFELTKQLSQYLRDEKYLNTQEQCFGFLALGKVARILKDSDLKAEIKSGENIIARYDGSKDIALYANDLAGNEINISTFGKEGELFYFYETEGISKTGNFKEEDSYFKIRRNFYDTEGNKITNNQFERGKLYVVELLFENEIGYSADNVVITDLFPTGLEMESGSLNGRLPFSWIKKRKYTNNFDARDDRINIFVDNVYGGEKYYYMVRAVSTGKFELGAVSADAMYKGEYHSYNGKGWIEVKDKE